MNRLKMPLVSAHAVASAQIAALALSLAAPNGGGGRRRRIDPERAWNPELSEW
jgi:hypothetical protein